MVSVLQIVHLKKKRRLVFVKSLLFLAGFFLIAASSAEPARAEALRVSCSYPAESTSRVEFAQTSSDRMVFTYILKGEKLQPVADTFETHLLPDTDSYKFNLNFAGSYLVVDFPRSSLEAQGRLFKGVGQWPVKMNCIWNRPEQRLF